MILPMFAAPANFVGRSNTLTIIGVQDNKKLIRFEVGHGRLAVQRMGFAGTSQIIAGLAALRNGCIAAETYRIRNGSTAGGPALSVVRFAQKGTLQVMERMLLGGEESLCASSDGSMLYCASTTEATAYRVSSGGRLSRMASARYKLSGYNPSAAIDPAGSFMTVTSSWNPGGNLVPFIDEVAIQLRAERGFGKVQSGLPFGKVIDGAHRYASFELSARATLQGVRRYATLSQAAAGKPASARSIFPAISVYALDGRALVLYFANGDQHELCEMDLSTGRTSLISKLEPLAITGMELSSGGRHLLVFAKRPAAQEQRLLVFELRPSRLPLRIANVRVPAGTQLLPAGVP